MSTTDRRQLEAELDILVDALVNPASSATFRAQVVDELRRRVQWLAGNRASVLMPTGQAAAITPAGAAMATVTIGPDELAALRPALAAIATDAAHLRRIAAAGTPAQAAAAMNIPDPLDRLPAVWREVLR